MQTQNMRFPALLSLILLASTQLHADDGAASIAAGGLILMKREPRITMAKEVLAISQTKVVVDYDFRNDSADNITTEVAFPIPAFEFPSIGDNASLKQLGFDDFQLWVNGRPIKFTVETRAFLEKQDVTPTLAAMNIDIGTFGRYGNKAKNPKLNFYATDIERLTAAQKAQLVQQKLISGTDSRADDWQALWRVEKKYHWTQNFPAHGTVHVRHQYTPVVGTSNMIGDMTKYDPKSGEYSELASLCPTPAMVQGLGKTDLPETDPTGLSYVDFILTTANTWKTPIEDFTLIVERPAEDYRVNDVSLCWDGPVTKTDANHFSAHISGLVPAKELRVGFIHSDWTRAEMKQNQQYDKDNGLKP